MSLREVQTAFMQAVFSKDESGIASHLTDTRGVAIYRNNIHAALTKALQAIYPVILRLVDEGFFKFAAGHYIERYPSNSGDLNHFGVHFAEFLAKFPPAAQLAYLPDVARLEWYCHRAYLAADDTTMDLQRLAAVSPENYDDLRFHLNSASHLLRSPWPIDSIWRVNQDDYRGDQAVDLNQGGIALLIQRVGNKILLSPLSAAEWAFLSAVAEDQSLAAVLESTQEIDPGVDAGALLRKFVAQETLAAFSLSATR